MMDRVSQLVWGLQWCTSHCLSTCPVIKGSGKQNNITQAAVIYLERTRSLQDDYVLSKAKSDDDTYVRYAKQAELHHACRTERNEQSFQIKDSLFLSVQHKCATPYYCPITGGWWKWQPALIIVWKSSFIPDTVYMYVPIMDLYNWSQPELLSPSQCPVHFPLEG